MGLSSPLRAQQFKPQGSAGVLEPVGSTDGHDIFWVARADKAFEWERSIDEVAEADEELAAYVQQLESSRDALDSEDVSGDSLARELEKYLKNRPESPEAGKA